jgi:hypothetical protein
MDGRANAPQAGRFRYSSVPWGHNAYFNIEESPKKKPAERPNPAAGAPHFAEGLPHRRPRVKNGR